MPSLHCTSDPHGRVQNVGQRDFPDYDMLDAMIASAMKRLLDKHVHFRKKSKCRRAACSKYDRFLRERTNCLHDPRASPCNRSLWSGTRTLRLVQNTFTE